MEFCNLANILPPELYCGSGWRVAFALAGRDKRNGLNLTKFITIVCKTKLLTPNNRVGHGREEDSPGNRQANINSWINSIEITSESELTQIGSNYS